MYAIVYPQITAITVNSGLPTAASLPIPLKINLVAKNVPTANQPTCKRPIKSPGIRYPPAVPNVELPTTYKGKPVFMPSIAGA